MVAPTPAEVRQYVQEHSFGYGLLFSRFFKDHVDEEVTLVALANEKCARSDTDSFLCHLDVTGRFVSGEQATRRMQIEFTRDKNGALEEIITMSGD